MISRRLNLLFVHIPKTGGTTITEALLPYANDERVELENDPDTFELRLPGAQIRKHSPYHVYKKELGPTAVAGFLKFTVVRNPWDQILSWFFHYIKTHNAKTSKFGAEFSTENFLSFARTRPRFNTFLCDFYEEVYGDIEYRPISEHKIDIVLRFETLARDFEALAKQAGLPSIDLGRRNVGDHLHYTEYYTPNLKQAIYEICAKDIEFYGYKFD